MQEQFTLSALYLDLSRMHLIQVFDIQSCVLYLQVILLEEAWAELFLLCAIQWSMPMESSPLLSATEHAQNAPNGKAAATLADIRVLQEILSRFKAVQVDPAEFACLKAIALFKPGKCFMNICMCPNRF